MSKSLVEINNFLEKYADEYRVWIGAKGGGQRGESFKTFAEAKEYYKSQCGYAENVALEAVLVIKEFKREVEKQCKIKK